MTWGGSGEFQRYAIAVGLPSGLYYNGYQDVGRTTRENRMRHPLMWTEHDVALEARTFRSDILEDEGNERKVPKKTRPLVGRSQGRDSSSVRVAGRFAHNLANLARMS